MNRMFVLLVLCVASENAFCASAARRNVFEIPSVMRLLPLLQTGRHQFTSETSLEILRHLEEKSDRDPKEDELLFAIASPYLGTNHLLESEYSDAILEKFVKSVENKDSRVYIENVAGANYGVLSELALFKVFSAFAKFGSPLQRRTVFENKEKIVANYGSYLWLHEFLKVMTVSDTMSRLKAIEYFNEYGTFFPPQYVLFPEPDSTKLVFLERRAEELMIHKQYSELFHMLRGPSAIGLQSFLRSFVARSSKDEIILFISRVMCQSLIYGKMPGVVEEIKRKNIRDLDDYLKSTFFMNPHGRALSIIYSGS